MTEDTTKTAVTDTIMDDETSLDEVWVLPEKANSFKVFGFNFLKVVAAGIFFQTIILALEGSMFGTVSATLHSLFAVLSLNDLPQIAMMISGVLGPAVVKFAEVYGQFPLAVSGVFFAILTYSLFIVSGNPGHIMNGATETAVLTWHSYCFVAGQMTESVARVFLSTLETILITVYIPIRLRATFTAVVNLPNYLIRLVAPLLATSFYHEWRLIFVVTIPVVLLSFFVMYYPLVKIENKYRKKRQSTSFIQICKDLDLIGALLLICGVCCTLAPPMINYSESITHSKNLIPLVIGIICILLFVPYEYYLAPTPVFHRRLVTNITLVCCLIVNAIIYAASNMAFSNFSALFQITKGVSDDTAAMLQYGYGAGYGAGALICGLLIQYTRKLKIWIWSGYLVYLLGFCLFLNTRGAVTSIAEVVIVQIVAGIGCGISLPAIYICVQAAVEKRDVPMAATLVTFTTYVFGPFCGLFASSIWNRYLPDIIAAKPGGNTLDMFGIVDTILSNWKSDSYNEVQKNIIIESYLETQRLTTFIAIGMLVVGLAPIYFIRVNDLPEEENTKEKKENQVETVA
ncbi:hypothetical protein HDU92_006119 [Lobulomyces angularis]|nr:hypothetical protein HDU92_006119 [Lobulomyces angularis]